MVLPFFPGHSKMVKCPICDDSLEDDNGEETIFVCTTPCGHVFHEDCIKKWIRIKTKCIAMDPRSTADETVKCPFGCGSIRRSKLVRIYLSSDRDARPPGDFKLKSRKQLYMENAGLKRRLKAEAGKMQQVEEMKDAEIAKLTEQATQMQEKHELQISYWISMCDRAVNMTKQPERSSSAASSLCSFTSSASGLNTPPNGVQSSSSEQEVTDSGYGETKAQDNLLTTSPAQILTGILADELGAEFVTPSEQQDYSQRPTSADSTSTSSSECGLKVGSLVVWPDDDDNYSGENGVVVWLGVIEDVQHAAVIFENKMEDSVGVHLCHPKAWLVKPGHGQLIQVQELVSYSDFHGYGARVFVGCESLKRRVVRRALYYGDEDQVNY